jgi:hypothetical protein
MSEKTKSGSGLIFAVVLLFVILGMVVTLSSITVLETKMNQKTKSSVGAFYNADSGIEWALNKIASTTASDINTAFDVLTPANGVQPSTDAGYKVYFLDKDGKVIKNGALPPSDIKAVRAVGTQGEEAQRAIEAAVAAGGGGCFTYYCGGVGAEQACTDNGGTQKYCPTGFNQLYAMGHWGSCGYGSAIGYYHYFHPPGGGCRSDQGLANIGEAFVCCQ